MYGYDAQNKRIWNWSGSTDQYGKNASGYSVYYYGVKGERLGLYNFIVGYYAGSETPTLENSTTSNETYFGARRLAPLDRLGSARTVNGGFASYYPFGEDKSTNPTGEAWRFGTYWGDSVSGLDYAVNRFYSGQLGRFLIPDKMSASAAGVPQAWNAYTYAGGDPIHNMDPSGRAYVCADSGYTSASGSSSPNCYWQYGADDQGPPDTQGCVVDDFDPTPDPACNPPGPGPTPQTPAPPVPQCSISLDERGAGFKYAPWKHTCNVINAPFLVQDGYAANELNLQAGLSNNFPIGGTLTSQITTPGIGLGSNHNNPSNPGKPGNSEIGLPYTGANACLDIGVLLAAIANYDLSKQVPYMAVPIPGISSNSNSFTWTLLNDVSLSFGFPGFAPGWGAWLSVPGLMP